MRQHASICHAVSDFMPAPVRPASSSPPTAGTAWTPETFPGTVTNFTGISCADTLHCTAVGSSSGGPAAAILSTTNGGAPGPRRPFPPLSAASTASRAPATRRAWPPVPRHRHDRRRCATGTTWEAPAGATTLASVSCISCDHLHGGRWREHPRTRPTAEPRAGPSQAVAIRSRVSRRRVSAPARPTAKPSAPAPNFGGTIATLSAPPTRHHDQPRRRHHRRAVHELAGRQRGLGALLVGRHGRCAAARAPPGTERHPQRHADHLRASTRSPSPSPTRTSCRAMRSS